MKLIKPPKLIREEPLGNSKLTLYKGKITGLGGGAIVCPTDIRMRKLPGITTTILEAGNVGLLQDLQKKTQSSSQYKPRHIEPYEIISTSGGSLSVVRILHICVPDYDRNDPEPLIIRFIEAILRYAEELLIESIIIPCLTKEAFGFTPEQCAFGYFATAQEYFNTNRESCIKEIRFVSADKKQSKGFEREADRRFGVREKRSFFSFGKKNKSKKGQGPEIELKEEEKKQS